MIGQTFLRNFLLQLIYLWIKVISIFYPSIKSFSIVSNFLLRDDVKQFEKDEQKHNKSQIISFYDCIPSLDEKILNLSLHECRELFQLFQKVNHYVYLTKELSNEFKNNGVNLSASQIARITKLCDSITTLQLINYPIPIFSMGPSDIPAANDETVLNHLYNYQVNGDIPFLPNLIPPVNNPSNSNIPAPVSKNISDIKSLYTFLPDADYINFFIAKTRAQLKVIDEMSNSKKNDHLKFKFSGKKTLYSLMNQFSSASTPGSGNPPATNGPSSLPFSSNSMNKIFDLSVLKYLMKELSVIFDQLELVLNQHSVLLSYFSYVKQEIHRPYYQLLLNLKLLPNFYEIERKLFLESEHYLSQEKSYTQKIRGAVPKDLSLSSAASSSSNLTTTTSPVPVEQSSSNTSETNATKNPASENQSSTSAVVSNSAPPGPTYLSPISFLTSGKLAGNSPVILYKTVEIMLEYQALLKELMKLSFEFSQSNQLSRNTVYINAVDSTITLPKETKLLTVPQKEIIKVLFSLKKEDEDDIKDCLCFK